MLVYRVNFFEAIWFTEGLLIQLFIYLFIYLFIFMIIFCHLQVENVVVHFVRQNKRVLVVGSGPMKLNTTRQGGAQTPLGTLMDYLIDHDHCGVFCPKGRYSEISCLTDVFLPIANQENLKII